MGVLSTQNDYINFTAVIAVVTYLLLFLFFISEDNKINSCALNWWCVLLLSYGFCLILWASFYFSFYHSFFLWFCFCNMVRSYVQCMYALYYVFNTNMNAIHCQCIVTTCPFIQKPFLIVPTEPTNSHASSQAHIQTDINAFLC